MKKFTVNDFSGGIQEATSPNDFSPRQWAQLKGIVPSSDVSFETQWAIQTLGTGSTNSNFQAVFPLSSTDGVYLVAIKANPGQDDDGSIWWAKAPDPDASYTTANSTVTWAEIVTARNLGWASGNSTTQPSVPVDKNPTYKFICPVPLQVYKYYRNPLDADKDNPSKDTDVAGTRTAASGVLIHSAERDTSQQALIVYIDTSVSPAIVSAIAFPAVRRLPQHGDSGDFINARVTDGTTTYTYTVPNWIVNRENERFQPYTWVDVNGTLRPGTGIIPRANVGTMKGDKLILGDIEWRTDFNQTAEKLSNIDATNSVTNNAFFGSNLNGVSDQYIVWPADVATTGRVIYNSGPGEAYLSDTNTITMYTQVGGDITFRQRTSGVSMITTSSAHGLAVGSTVTIEITGVKSSFEGTFVVSALGDYSNNNQSTCFRYFQTGKSNVASTATTAGTGKVLVVKPDNYKYKVAVGAYQAIPNEWDYIYVSTSVPDTRLNIARQLNAAAHVMNDANTGPHRGSIYYAEEDLDQFDPRSVLKPSKSDVRIAGLHTLDDTIVAITTAGTAGDGVLRIRGFLSKLHPYSGTADPSAVRIELVRGGLGAPERAAGSTRHKNYSCVWSEAGIVVFIDRLGGIFYTDGQVCDRLDRFGPVPATLAEYSARGVTREDDHTASLGKHMFAYRGGRLLCFTMLSSTAGSTGSGCWTELVLPSGACKSFVGAREDLYFINAGKVHRFALLAPAVERGTINGLYNASTNPNGITLTLTVSTATFGSEDEHDRTNWHRVGMTFDCPTVTNPVTVGTVTVRSAGALSPSSGSEPTAWVTTLNRSYGNPSVLGEFVVPAGIGPQAMASATVTFTGHVKLKSVAFWTTGREPRRGDS